MQFSYVVKPLTAGDGSGFSDSAPYRGAAGFLRFDSQKFSEQTYRATESKENIIGHWVFTLYAYAVLTYSSAYRESERANLLITTTILNSERKVYYKSFTGTYEINRKWCFRF